MLTQFYADLNPMGIQQCPNYYGFQGGVYVQIADGTVQYLAVIVVEIRFTRPGSGEPWGPWIFERAVLRMEGPGQTRLSGRGMRDYMWFGTPPGYRHVAVASFQGGMNAVI